MGGRERDLGVTVFIILCGGRTADTCTRVSLFTDPSVRNSSNPELPCSAPAERAGPAVHLPPLSPCPLEAEGPSQEPAMSVAFTPDGPRSAHRSHTAGWSDCRQVCGGWKLVTAMLGTDRSSTNKVYFMKGFIHAWYALQFSQPTL